MRTFLTKNGNILKVDSNSGYFYNGEGNFLRHCTSEEVQYFMDILPQIKFISQLDWETPMNWEFLWSVKHSNFSSYKAETCRNGGDYAFYTEQRYYARKTRKGWQFKFVEVYSTSAEFDFDEIKGQFQSTSPTWAIDGNLCLQTQVGGEFTISSIGHDCELNDALKAPNTWNDPAEGWNCAPVVLSYSDLKSRIEKLREMGISRKKDTKRKNHRRR